MMENGVDEEAVQAERMDNWIVWECEERAAEDWIVSFSFFFLFLLFRKDSLIPRALRTAHR